MRNLARRSREEEEEESVFVPMTDMTVSFLFIIIILLAYFASKFQTSVANVEDYAERAKAVREQILEEISEEMLREFPQAKQSNWLTVDKDAGALRFAGTGLFDINKETVKKEMQPVIERLAKVLFEKTKCFTRNNFVGEYSCNQDDVLIESIQIEGHTSNTGSLQRNLVLSGQRSRETFWLMVGSEPRLMELRNLNEQHRVISFAGYGPWRPVANNGSEDGRQSNRRIDIRIIMHTPATPSDTDRLRRQIREALDKDWRG